ncbi:MAG: hypothetical protein ACRDS0_33090 [Pseudonocardiaceae bacterium]
MRDPASIQVAGPLAPFVEGFVARLELWGYARGSRAGHLRLMADLSGWLGGRGLDGSALDAETVDGFVADRRAAGHRDARSARSLRPLLQHLRAVGAASPLVVRQRVWLIECYVRDPTGTLLSAIAALGVISPDTRSGPRVMAALGGWCRTAVSGDGAGGGRT